MIYTCKVCKAQFDTCLECFEHVTQFHVSEIVDMMTVKGKENKCKG
jgi:hypothetical protein